MTIKEIQQERIKQARRHFYAKLVMAIGVAVTGSNVIDLWGCTFGPMAAISAIALGMNIAGLVYSLLLDSLMKSHGRHLGVLIGHNVKLLEILSHKDLLLHNHSDDNCIEVDQNPEKN